MVSLNGIMVSLNEMMVSLKPFFGKVGNAKYERIALKCLLQKHTIIIYIYLDINNSFKGTSFIIVENITPPPQYCHERYVGWLFSKFLA